ncbi:hypothetical protein XFLAVUS301_23920 [Xanthobacter flavus]|uniref:Uncharacterized protein n=1 Tax=Xanthobacter flavus TaxID=281 RepID=A0A9W6CRT8_XANFL|nr:hypothetical protein XFLAVUS301_23920 [Xanthobacter flavus]
MPLKAQVSRRKGTLSPYLCVHCWPCRRECANEPNCWAGGTRAFTRSTIRARREDGPTESRLLRDGGGLGTAEKRHYALLQPPNGNGIIRTTEGSIYE